MPAPPRPPPRRPGSVGMVAMSVLFVLGIVVGVLNFVGTSSHKLFYHAYYNEKALALIEGVNGIARGVAQGQLSTLLEKPDEWVEITGEVEGVATQMRLWEDSDTFKPTIKVEARVLKAPMHFFAEDEGYQSVQESKADSGIFQKGNELEGKVQIRSSVSFELSGPNNFSVPARKVTAEYEFKRILRTPRLLRQFVLFVKDASTSDDDHKAFEGSTGYNRVGSNMAGDASDGAVFLAPQGSATQGTEAPLPMAAGNPFKDVIGYVYLGGDRPIFLNLAAGNDQSDYSETFQLYKGESTNFYKLWGTDYTSFVEQAKTTPKGGGGGGLLGAAKTAWNWAKTKIAGLFNKMKDLVNVMDRLDSLALENPDMKIDLPLYYIVRKDYGYATEWAQPRFKKFGFTKGGGVYSSTLHLYGVQQPRNFGTTGVGGDENFSYTGATWGPTLVMGRVYRRVLSLAGYKQRRGSSDPSQDRRFEIQAGPIEYFEDLDALHKRKMDPRKGGEEGPIWVWDNRVDWFKEGGGGQEGSTGTYIPISGYGLSGRLLPSLPRFQQEHGEGGKLVDIWKHSLLPPKEIAEETTPDDAEKAAELASRINDLSDFPEHLKGGISPVILAMWKKGFFTRAVTEGGATGPWVHPDNAPYFEELVRNFSYASTMSDEERQQAGQSLPAGEGLQPDPNAEYSEDDIRKALLTGDSTWRRLAAAAGPQGKIQTSQFKDESAGKAKFWEQSDSTPEPLKGIYPFSLPDPWSNDTGGAGGGGGGTVRPLKHNWQKFFDSTYTDKEEIYDKFVAPIMTDPGRTLPYNYSMRFVFAQIRELFLQGEEERWKLLSRMVAPEVRDGIGFRVPGENEEYLALADEGTGEGVKFDRALDDDVLEKIYEKRQSDDYLKQGYFFMDEYGGAVTAPRDVNIEELYTTGQRYCWKTLSMDDFKERFGPAGEPEPGRPQEISFGNAVEFVGDFDLFDKAPTNVMGGGVLLVKGTVKISQSVSSQDPLTIIADRIEIGSTADNVVVKAMLVAKEMEITGGVIIEGALIADKWNLSQGQAPGGRVLVSYNPAFKSEESFVQVIEPRISKITIDAGDTP